MFSDFSFAYQPIVDVCTRSVESFEALVRGPNGESASWVFARLQEADLPRFDRDARLRAIELAAELSLPCRINLNLLPRTLTLEEGVQAVQSTVDMARRHGIGAARLVLEVSERDSIAKPHEFVAQIRQFQAMGVRFSLDDFGAGHSGLNLLAEFQPESIKLDMALIRGIHSSGPRQAIVRGVLRTAIDLGIDIVAEGVESADEHRWLRDEGINLFQGFLFAKPAFRALPSVHFPSD